MITKKVSPKGKSVRVTFELPADAAEKSAFVVGDFNDWNATEGEMKFNATKKVWAKSVSFKPGDTVEFRYLIDEGQWLNDEEADEYKATPYFSENSVLAL